MNYFRVFDCSMGFCLFSAAVSVKLAALPIWFHRMDSTLKFLVMDGDQRSALAVTRALGQFYPTAIIHTAEARTDALAAASKFSHQHWQYPSPSDKPADFIAWVKAHCTTHNYSVVIPTTEVTSQLLLLHKQHLPNVPLALADIDTVMAVANKAQLVESAKKAGVPVPATQHYANAGELNKQSVTYPCVLKPALSKIYTGNSWIATTVRPLKDQSELEQVLAQDTYLNDHPFMIQEFIEGHGAGLFCLYNQGQAVQFFAHQRLREKPPEGGVSVLSQAMPVDETLKADAKKLLDSVGWHGVAMVEFRIAQDGTAYLMEVNTRFWGSLQLSIDSGVNFPVQLVQAFLNQPIATAEHYNTQQRLRWLMGDIDSLYIYLKRPHSLPQKLKRVLAFFTPRLRNQRHEVNRLSDMGPFITELKHYFRG